MGYYTRVLSKDEEFPSFEELARLVSDGHPDYRLSIEEGTEEEWEMLLLAGIDEVEVALIERNPVWDGSIGQDEVADFLEELQDCRPKSGVQWLENYLAVKTIYAFQHLQGSEKWTAEMLFMRCARRCGSAGTRSSRRTARGSRMRMATTLCGSFPTRFQGRGIWGCCRMASGITSRWTWEIRIIGRRF